MLNLSASGQPQTTVDNAGNANEIIPTELGDPIDAQRHGGERQHLGDERGLPRGELQHAGSGQRARCGLSLRALEKRPGARVGDTDDTRFDPIALLAKSTSACCCKTLLNRRARN